MELSPDGLGVFWCTDHAPEAERLRRDIKNDPNPRKSSWSVAQAASGPEVRAAVLLPRTRPSLSPGTGASSCPRRAPGPAAPALWVSVGRQQRNIGYLKAEWPLTSLHHDLDVYLLAHLKESVLVWMLKDNVDLFFTSNKVLLLCTKQTENIHPSLTRSSKGEAGGPNPNP